MAVSENGWPVDGRTNIASFQIPGGLIPVRKGDVATVLVWCAQRWHQTVEPLVWPGCWGYADRNVRDSTTVISNHASGTAIDLNAPAHPRGVPTASTMSPAKIAACRAIVAASGGVLRWGGDYRPPSQPDSMHWEINASPAAVAALAAKIRAGQVGATTTQGGPFMALTDQQQTDLLMMVSTLHAQLTGDVDGPGPDGMGWPTFRHDGGPDLTLVDLARSNDRELNSRLDLGGRPGPEADTIFGHVLSLRAELRTLGSDVVGRLAKLSQTGGLPAAVAEADPDTLTAIAAAVADEQDRRQRARLAA